MSESPDPAEFPTYMELTQTQGWAGGGPVAVATGLISSDLEVSRYTESAVLGTGGMGKVVLARDARIGREVALKVQTRRVQLADEAHARFLREAQVQGQLEHPSIVPVYDIDRGSDGNTFFTMRRVLGKTLKAIIEELRDRTTEKPRTRRELLQAFATVCLAVDYAHSRGVIHRDLKPANIMLGDFGEVYVLDWGVARVLEDSATLIASASDSGEPGSRLSRPGITMGTPLYIAPEQVADPDVGAAADVFSLGAILFEILTLQQLRTAQTLYDAIEARPSVRAPNLDIAPELENICVRATQAEAGARYPTARALQEAVARYLEGDRELEHRRTLAMNHAARARMALAADTPQDEAAMLELARALALDPTNIEHVAMMSEVLSSPPRTTPPEIERRLDDASQDTLLAGARYAAASFGSWFLFFPLLIALGVQRWDYVIALVLTLVAAVAVGVVATKQAQIRPPIQYAIITFVQLATLLLSRLFGPLVLAPTIVASSAMVIQAHPDGRLRLYGLITGMLAIGLPVVLELAGVIPPSYTFTNGFEVIPQMTDFPAGPTIAFLCIASIATVLVPSMFVARMRKALLEAQRRELLQSWRLRRLGENLLQVVH